MDIYCLAINPDNETIDIVRKQKLGLRKFLKKRYGSVDSLAHITLIFFIADEKTYPLVLAELRKVLSNLRPFMVELSGYGHFPKNKLINDPYSCTFYIKPTKACAGIIKQYCKIIETKFDDGIKRQCLTWSAKALETPHMSIARELLEKDIDKCYTFYTTEFSRLFYCNSFVIRRLNFDRGQYDIIDHISLRGNGYMLGNQLGLNF